MNEHDLSTEAGRPDDYIAYRVAISPSPTSAYCRRLTKGVAISNISDVIHGRRRLPPTPGAFALMHFYFHSLPTAM